MGWLDKGFKNLLKGGKELMSSPAGIMALGVLAPYAAPWMTKVGGMKGPQERGDELRDRDTDGI